MLAFVTGSSLGLALGWILHANRGEMVRWLFLYVGVIASILFRVLVLPMATASGAMDMTLWEFTLFALDAWISDGLANVMS